jgi:hypothetical protein
MPAETFAGKSRRLNHLRHPGIAGVSSACFMAKPFLIHTRRQNGSAPRMATVSGTSLRVIPSYFSAANAP